VQDLLVKKVQAKDAEAAGREGKRKRRKKEENWKKN
jgi:hypothetical protein